MRLLITLLFSSGMIFLMAACGESKEDDYTGRMAKEHQGDTPVSNQSKTYKQQQPVDTAMVDYAETDEGAISGYYAEPLNAGDDLPGILVIHEWWGLNDNIRMMTRRLAGLGYKALAVDLYNGQTAESSDGAHKLMKKAMGRKSENINNFKQAYAYLIDKHKAGNIGVIGWCFGGGWSLQTALALPAKIDAAVIYYGQLVTNKEQLRPLGMPILGFFGGQDNSIPTKEINTFEDNLKSLGKDVQVHVYDDAGHAFANPSGNKYNKKAAQDAWDKTKVFLKNNLK